MSEGSVPHATLVCSGHIRRFPGAGKAGVARVSNAGTGDWDADERLAR